MGDPRQVTQSTKIMSDIVSKVPDAQVMADTVDKMKTALAAGTPAAKASQIVVYPQAPHGFHADYRPSFRKEAADDGWKRALDWFKAHGVA